MLAIAVWAAVKNALSYVSDEAASSLTLPATGEEILRCLTLAHAKYVDSQNDGDRCVDVAYDADSFQTPYAFPAGAGFAVLLAVATWPRPLNLAERRTAGRAAQSLDSIHWVGIGLRDYASAHGTFTPTTKSSDDGVLLNSWR